MDTGPPPSLSPVDGCLLNDALKLFLRLFRTAWPWTPHGRTWESRYRTLLTSLAGKVTAVQLDRPETSGRVRDARQAAGAPIGSVSVNTAINGFLSAGLDLTAKPTAKKGSETGADNVVVLCRRARIQLGPKDVAAIRA